MVEGGLARSSNESAQIDAVKGVFISLVVIGHNVIMTDALAWLFPLLYAFHVFAFLFLPFIIHQRSLTWGAVRDRGVRYFAPYCVFVLGSWVLYRGVVHDGSTPSFEAAITGLVVGSAFTLDNASGFQLFWFLPAIFSLFIFRGVYAGLGCTRKFLFLAGLVAMHPVVGELPLEIKRYVPFGLLIVVYVYPLGVFCEYIWGKVKDRYRAQAAALSLTAFALCAWWVVEARSFVNLAALSLYGYNDLVRLLVHDAMAVSAFVGTLAASSILASSRLLVFLGGLSFSIYLSHSLIYQALTRTLCDPLLCWSGGREQAAVGGLILVATLGISVAMAKLVARSRILSKVIFPRSISDWSGFSR